MSATPGTIVCRWCGRRIEHLGRSVQLAGGGGITGEWTHDEVDGRGVIGPWCYSGGDDDSHAEPDELA